MKPTWWDLKGQEETIQEIGDMTHNRKPNPDTINSVITKQHRQVWERDQNPSKKKTKENKTERRLLLRPAVYSNLL